MKERHYPGHVAEDANTPGIQKASKPQQIISAFQDHNAELHAHCGRLLNVLAAIAGRVPALESGMKNEKERPAPEGLLNVVLSLQTDGRTELAQAVELVAIIENELGI